MEHGNQSGAWESGRGREGRGGEGSGARESEWSTGIRVEQRGGERREGEWSTGTGHRNRRCDIVVSATLVGRAFVNLPGVTHTHLFTHRLCPASSFDHKSPLPLLTARSPSHTALLTCPPLALPPLTAASHPSHRWLVQLLSRPRAKFDEVSEQKKKRGS